MYLKKVMINFEHVQQVIIVSKLQFFSDSEDFLK